MINTKDNVKTFCNFKSIACEEKYNANSEYNEGDVFTDLVLIDESINDEIYKGGRY